MTKMHVCMLTPSFLPVVGGAEILVHELGRRLVDRGHQVSLVTPKFLNANPGEELEGVKIYRVDRIPKFPLYEQLLESLKISQINKRDEIDVLHNFFVFASGGAAYLSKKTLKKPLVITLTGWDIYDPVKPVNRIFHPYMRFIMNHADAITAISNDQKYHARQMGAKKNIEVIPVGIDIKRFNADIKSNTKKKLGITGSMIFTVKRLVPRAGLEYLLHAVPELIKKHPDTKFVVGGTGILVEHLEKKVIDLGIQENVVLSGFISSEELPEYYSACDLFVLPSLYEGFGIVYLEAMSSGKPVVATDSGATREVVIDGKTGILVPPRDSKKLGDAISHLLDNPRLMRDMGGNGRKRVEEEYLWDDIVDKYEEIYNLISGSKPASD